MALKKQFSARGYPEFFKKNRKAAAILKNVREQISHDSRKVQPASPFIVLVTGIGNTGKTSLRRALTEQLKKAHPDFNVREVDMDRWRHSKKFSQRLLPDGYNFRSCCYENKVPKKPTIYIVEDVQAITREMKNENRVPLGTADKIIYVGAASLPKHMVNWTGRAWQWFKHGQGMLRDGKLVERPYAPENIPVITKELKAIFSERNPRFMRDLMMLNGFKNKTILLTGKDQLPFIRHMK